MGSARGCPCRWAPLLGIVLALWAMGCGRARKPNVPPGEEVVFARRTVADAGGAGASDTGDKEVLSQDELKRRHTVRGIEKLFQEATSDVDRLDVLGKILDLKLRAPELVGHIGRTLTSPDMDLRAYGVRARAMVSPGNALPDIQMVLRDPDARVRQAAVEALGTLDPLPVDAVFAHLEKEQDPLVQQAAMLVFAQRGAEADAQRIVAVLGDLDVKAVGPVVDYARKYPGAMKAHADALAYYLDRNDADLRLQVAKLFGDWGTRTPAALSALVRALKDPELAVRRAAFAALRTLANKDFDYDPSGSPEARDAAAEQFRAWIEGAAESR